MRVLVDALPFLGEANIATYLRQLLLSLAAEDGLHEYRLFFRAFRKDTRARIARLSADPRFIQFQTKIVRIPDRLLDWCWTERSLHLPLTEVWLGRPDLFLSTIYMTPVVKRTAVVMIAYDLIPLRFPQFYGHDLPLLTARIRRSIERAAIARSVLEQLSGDARRAGPPTDAELADVLRERWADLDRLLPNLRSLRAISVGLSSGPARSRSSI